jgi:hypothetical protein
MRSHHICTDLPNKINISCHLVSCRKRGPYTLHMSSNRPAYTHVSPRHKHAYVNVFRKCKELSQNGTWHELTPGENRLVLSLSSMPPNSRLSPYKAERWIHGNKPAIKELTSAIAKQITSCPTDKKTRLSRPKHYSICL